MSVDGFVAVDPGWGDATVVVLCGPDGRFQAYEVRTRESASWVGAEIARLMREHPPVDIWELLSEEDSDGA